MKKILLVFTCILLLSASAVQAKTIKVVALKEFSSQNPSPSFEVQTIQDEFFKNGLILYKETVISGLVIKVEQPKRGKRNAYFEFVPTKIYYNHEETNIKVNLIAKVVAYHPVDPEKLIGSVAKKAVGIVFKGASLGISFIEGVAQAKDGERVKSGFIKTYKDSPLSFIEVGSELNVGVGDTLVLKLKKIR